MKFDIAKKFCNFFKNFHKIKKLSLFDLPSLEHNEDILGK